MKSGNVGARVLGLAAASVMGLALYWTVRVEVSDWLYRRWSPRTVRQAVTLAPLNPEYYRGWSEIEPARAVGSLEKAAQLDPLNSTLWILLGQAEEERGEFGKAESALLHAVELDQNFAPRWVLSDFYYHRRDAARFWPVVREALAVSYDDVSELFRNCWSLSQDAEWILRRAIPERPAVLRQYLAFLIREKRMPAAAAVVDRLLARAVDEDRDTLLNYCDSRLGADAGEQALTVWNGLIDRKLLPYARLAGRSLTNGDFGALPINAGFDWRLTPPEGVYVERVGKPASLLVTFTGKQPEECEILSQFVPVLPGRQYVLRVRYAASGIPAEAGPLCRLVQGGLADVLHGGGLLPGGPEGDTTREFRFTTAAESGLLRLVLGYRRMPGTVRIEGSVNLREFQLELAQEGGR